MYKEHGNRQMQENSWARTDMRMLKFFKLSKEEFAAQRKRALSHEPGAVKALEDGQCFDLGGRTLRVVHMPGHTAGSCLLFLQNDGEEVIFCGDVVFLCGIGRTDGFSGTTRAMLDSLANTPNCPRPI